MNPLALVGVWNGQAIAPNLTLLIVLEFMKTDFNKNAPVNAYIDIPDLYVFRYFITQLSVKQNNLGFSLPSLEGSFNATFNEKKINGIWKNDLGAEFKIDMKKKSSMSVYNEKKPQTPHKPYPYVDEEVLIKTRNGLTLSGTFTYPKNKKVSKAVVLAHGSGGMDRDESLWEHKPFMVVADFLTRNGIAVLRFDERGIGKSTGDFNSAIEDDFAIDVIDGIEYLDDRDDFHFKEIGIIGHSKGGLTAMIAANKSPNVDFIVLLGSPILKPREVLELQAKAFNKVLKKPKLVGELQVKLLYFINDLAQNKTETKEIKNKVFEYLDRRYNESKTADEQVSLMILKRDAIQYGFAEIFSSPWSLSTWDFDAEKSLSNLDIPILALWGSKDINVPPAENYVALMKILEESDNHHDSKALILDELNHFFQKSKTGSPLEYGVLKETFSPKLLKLLPIGY